MKTALLVIALLVAPPIPKAVRPLQSPKAASVQVNQRMAVAVPPKLVTISFESRDVQGNLKPIPFRGHTYWLQHSPDMIHWTRYATNVSSITVPAILARDYWRVEQL